MASSTPKRKRYKMSVLLFIFLIIEVVLYALFMYMDIDLSKNGAHGSAFTEKLLGTGFSSLSQLKFYSISLCFIYSLYMLIRYRKHEYVSVTIALAFTVLSDYLLLFKDNDWMIYGVISFLIVHSVYLYIIYDSSFKKTFWAILIRAAFAFAITIIIKITDFLHLDNGTKINLIIFLVVFYAIMFLGNIVILCKNYIIHKTTVFAIRHPGMFFVALLLFLLCDINVFIYNLGGYLPIKGDFFMKLTELSEILMWGFYLPSQVLIVFSAYYDEN